MAHHAGRLITFLSIAIALGACRRDVVTGTPDISASADNGLDIIIAPSSATLEPDHTLQFTATVRARGGEVVENAPVTWSSSDPSVATVSESGLMSTLGVGTAEIQATFANTTVSAVVTVANLTILRDVILYSTQVFGTPSDLAIIHPDGTGLRRLTTDHFGYAAPDVSPDGRHIAFASRGSGEWAIYIMNGDGTGRTTLAQRSALDGSPRWSPGGSQIAFRSGNETACGAVGRIFVINADGTGLRQVSPEDPALCYFDSDPTWSPDGSKIAFSRTGRLYVINADGTGLTATPTDGLVGNLDWSPDGTRLVYGNQADDGNIILVDPDGSNQVALTTTPEYDDYPRWSPDGQRVVFCRVINEDHFELFVINRDGTGERNLAVGCLASWSHVP